MPERTNALKRAIEEDLIPYLGALGFERDGKVHVFYQFRRRTDTRHDLVEIQFDKYGRPKFTVNFGQVGNEGIVDPYGRFVEAARVKIGNLVRRGRLHRWPLSIGWFGLKSWFGYRDANAAARNEIAKVIHLFPQVGEWFAAGRAGPNLRVYTVEANQPRQRRNWMQRNGNWPPADWTATDEEATRLAEAIDSRGARPEH